MLERARKRGQNNGYLLNITDAQPRRAKLDVQNLQLQFNKLDYHWSKYRRCSRGIAGSSSDCRCPPRYDATSPRASEPSMLCESVVIYYQVGI